VSQLLAEIQYDHLVPPEDLQEKFLMVEADERQLRLATARPRVGQGTFRSRLLDAYGRRCAITGEHTEIVLEAAHIQPYLGPRSNHPQNGLLLTKEFHALFDAGYVTVTPQHEIRVSPRIRAEWDNGHRYYPFDNTPLRLPKISTLGIVTKPPLNVKVGIRQKFFPKSRLSPIPNS
jgi:predicted restriction endonuclease